MDRISLSDTAKNKLSWSIRDLSLSSPYEEIEAFLVSICSVSASLPQDVLGKLRNFRNNPRAYGALLLQNMPLDDDLPPTPKDGCSSKNKKTFVSEACVLGVSQILGEPIGYRAEREGDIIQALCPVRAESHATSSASSEIYLGFHTDFSFDKANLDQPYNVLNPDYIVLLCLRSDRNAEAYTLYADARDICQKLTPPQLDVMRSPVFQFAASYSFTGACGADRIWSVPCPLLKGPAEFPELSVDLLCGVRGLSEEANSVLSILRDVCELPDVASRVCLMPGDLLIIDNRKGAHARTAFSAYFDGYDRWMHRVYVRRSLWELRKTSSRGLRVF